MLWVLRSGTYILVLTGEVREVREAAILAYFHLTMSLVVSCSSVDGPVMTESAQWLHGTVCARLDRHASLNGREFLVAIHEGEDWSRKQGGLLPALRVPAYPRLCALLNLGTPWTGNR